MLWKNLTNIPKKHPLAFGLAISTIKTSVCDLLVQTKFEKKDEIDWRRNLFFGAFGFAYLGGFQYAMYVSLFGRLFPGAESFASKTIKEKLKDTKGIVSMLSQLSLDQFLIGPFIYFPCFYISREFIMRDANDNDHDKPVISRALEAYKRNIVEDNLACWKVWVPAMFINFSVMPMWARIPLVTTVSLMWTCIISSMRGGEISNEKCRQDVSKHMNNQ